MKRYPCPHCGVECYWKQGFHAESATNTKHFCVPGTVPATYAKAHPKGKPARNRGNAEVHVGKTITGANYFRCTLLHFGPPWEREGCPCEFN